jgi:hypothetical protein
MFRTAKMTARAATSTAQAGVRAAVSPGHAHRRRDGRDTARVLVGACGHRLRDGADPHRWGLPPCSSPSVLILVARKAPAATTPVSRTAKNRFRDHAALEAVSGAVRTSLY